VHWPPNWQEYWKIDPTDFQGSPAMKARVVGGEACMWGEWVDATNLIPRLVRTVAVSLAPQA
jgi:hexosaminidase